MSAEVLDKRPHDEHVLLMLRPLPDLSPSRITSPQNNDTARRRLSAIVFRNFYCSHISVKQRRDPSVGTSFGTVRGIIDIDPWVTVLRDRALMEDPHFENDAQDWHVLTVEEFDQEQYDTTSTAPLRYVAVRRTVLCNSWFKSMTRFLGKTALSDCVKSEIFECRPAGCVAARSSATAAIRNEESVQHVSKH